MKSWMIFIITTFTGDVEQVKYKSSLLYFRAEESESGINALRFGAGSAFRPTGLTPCGVGMSRFTRFFKFPAENPLTYTRDWLSHGVIAGLHEISSGQEQGIRERAPRKPFPPLELIRLHNANFSRFPISNKASSNVVCADFVDIVRNCNKTQILDFNPSLLERFPRCTL